MKMKFVITILIASVSVIFHSCTDQESPMPNQIIFTKDGGEKLFKAPGCYLAQIEDINASYDGSVSKSDWLTVSLKDGYIILNADTNNKKRNRQCQVNCMVNNSGFIFKVIQLAN